MSEDEALLARGYDALNRGDAASADGIAARLVARHPRDGRVIALAGMAAYRRGEMLRAIPSLRAALSVMSGNEEIRAALAFSLLQSGRLDDAREVAAPVPIARFRRIVAMVDFRQGRHAQAVNGFRMVLAELPDDAESWSNLGLALSALGEIDLAIAAFEDSLRLNATTVETYVQLSSALAAGEHHARRQALLHAAVKRVPGAPELWVQLGLAEVAADDVEAAEVAYHNALATDPRHAAAYLEYGMLLERLNRLDDLDALIAVAHARGVTGGGIAFMKAWSCQRRGRFAEALALAGQATGSVQAARLAHLTGHAADRLGDVDHAVSAFEAMNRAGLDSPAARYALALDYTARIDDDSRQLTPEWLERWAPAPAVTDGVADPVFVVGFPRSGTTLLDTLLMNLPELAVFEEQPMIERIEAQIGRQSALADLSTWQIEGLRRRYLALAAERMPDLGSSRRIVDKFPLHLVRVPVVNRLFPNAPIVLVERHPCDVVLSSFMARFQTNQAMVQLSTIEGAARMYDAAMRFWSKAEALLPLSVWRICYERLVGDKIEAELRGLLTFLGLEWRPEVLENEASAKRRTRIETASYAQVGEPIYARAVDRWRQYRQHLEPVLPILAPWVERLGYRL